MTLQSLSTLTALSLFFFLVFVMAAVALALLAAIAYRLAGSSSQSRNTLWHLVRVVWNGLSLVSFGTFVFHVIRLCFHCIDFVMAQLP